jgi:hypothetical protein
MFAIDGCFNDNTHRAQRVYYFIISANFPLQYDLRADRDNVILMGAFFFRHYSLSFSLTASPRRTLKRPKTSPPGRWRFGITVGWGCGLV